jgi:hypothetical protein
VYSWKHEYEPIVMAVDLDGTKVANSATDLFDTPATEDMKIDVITATYTRGSYVPRTDTDPYLKRENSATVTVGFKTFVAGQLLLDDVTVEQVEEEGTFFYKITDTWKGGYHPQRTTSNTTTLAGAVAGAPASVTVAVGSLTGIVVGADVQVDTGDSAETVQVTAINGGAVTFTAFFTKNHANGSIVKSWSYRTWQFQPLDMGFNEVVVNEDLTASLVPIYVGSQLAPNPVLLNGSGQQTTTPNYLYFRIRDSVDFTARIAAYP